MLMTQQRLTAIIRHGGPHAHTGSMNGLQPWDASGMHKSAIHEAENRLDSPCADHKATVQAVAEFHLDILEQECVFMLMHDTNGDGHHWVFETAKGMAMDTLLHRQQDWPLYGLSYQGGYDQMPPDQERLLFLGCLNAACDMLMIAPRKYNEFLQRVQALKNRYPTKDIYAGVEVSLMPNGGLSTDRAHHPDCQYMILAPHVTYYPSGFNHLRYDPIAYSRWLAAGVREYRPHVLAHPGYKCQLDGDNSSDKETNFRQMMLWDAIAEACIEANTLLECSGSPSHNNLWRKPEEYQESSDKRVELYRKTSIINDPQVMSELEPYTAQGLTLVYCSDRHFIPQSIHQPLFSQWTEEQAAVLVERMVPYHLAFANEWPVEQQRQFYVNRYH